MHLSKRKLKMSSASGAVLIISLFALASVIMPAFADDNDPWTDIPHDDATDLGVMWGTLIQFEYTYDPDIGNQAETIEWDFGDGSDRSNEWNPQHRYDEPGVYYIVQHVTNSYNGGSESWGYYKITIMGQPYVHIIVPAGAPTMDDVYTTINTVPIKPEDPVWEGHTFVGYFADPENTVPYEWTLKINRPVTIYAVFSDDNGGPVDPIEPEPTDPAEEGEYVLTGTVLILTGIGVLIGAIAAYTRRPFTVVLALMCIVLAVLGVVGVIDIPEIVTNFDPIAIPFGGIL